MNVFLVLLIAFQGCYQGSPEIDSFQDAGVRHDADRNYDSSQPGDAEADEDSREGPLELLSYLDSEYASDVFVVGDLAYLVDPIEGLKIVDISDKREPRIIGREEFVEGWSLYIDEELAYIVVDRVGLDIYSVHNPAAIQEMRLHSTPGRLRDVVVHNGLAYVADGYEGLRISNVMDLTEIEDFGFWIINGEALHVVVDEVASAAFVSGTDNLLHVVDVSNPNELDELSTVNIPDMARDLDIVNSIAYVPAGPAGLRIIDVSNPSEPRNIGSFMPGDSRMVLAQRVAVRDTTAFLGVNGGLWFGIVILDVSDPEQPIEVGIHETRHPISSLFLDETYIYATEENAGFSILQQR